MSDDEPKSYNHFPPTWPRSWACWQGRHATPCAWTSWCPCECPCHAGVPIAEIPTWQPGKQEAEAGRVYEVARRKRRLAVAAVLGDAPMTAEEVAHAAGLTLIRARRDLVALVNSGQIHLGRHIQGKRRVKTYARRACR